MQNPTRDSIKSSPESQFFTRRLEAAFGACTELSPPQGWVGSLGTDVMLRVFARPHFYEIKRRVPESPSLVVSADKGVSVLFCAFEPKIEHIIPGHWPLLMARGLYKMGEEELLTALEDHFGWLLSQHDKVVYRDEMPRELWPESWKQGS